MADVQREADDKIFTDMVSYVEPITLVHMAAKTLARHL